MADSPATAPTATILVECPSCKACMRARADMVGRQAMCPKCKKPFAIQAAQKTAAPAAPAPVPSAPAAAKPAAPSSGSVKAAAPAKAATPAQAAAPAKAASPDLTPRRISSGRMKAVATGSSSKMKAASAGSSSKVGAAAGESRRMRRPLSSRRVPRVEPPKSNQKTIILIVAAVVIVAAVAGYFVFGEKGHTPEQLFQQVKTAVGTKDWAAVYDCLAPSERKKMEAEWEQQKKTLDAPEGQMMLAVFGPMLGVTDKEKIKKMTFKQIFIAMLKKAGELSEGKMDDDLAAFQKASLASAKIEGGRCILKVKGEKKDVDMPAVKEEGRWYLSGVKPKTGAAPAAPTAPATPAAPAASDAPAAPVTPAAPTTPVAPTTPAPAPEGTAPK
jgi:hypothetical protein